MSAFVGIDLGTTRTSRFPAIRRAPYRLRVSRARPARLEVFMTQGETLAPQGCKCLGKYVFSAIAQELTEGGGRLDPERMKARRQGLVLR
ncbi:MAG: hypothetical protein ACUVSX_15830 [Aggregatilineales bacterium]